MAHLDCRLHVPFGLLLHIRNSQSPLNRGNSLRCVGEGGYILYSHLLSW
jgi:hypothetical protein